MRLALALVLLAACGAAPPPAAVPAPPVDDGWSLQGTARLVGHELRFNYCCVAWASAEKAIDVGPGKWRMQLDHRNTECRTASHAYVFGADGIILGGVALDAGPVGAVADLDFDVDADTGVSKLLVGEMGEGLECCGTTEVAAITLVPR